MRSIKRFISNEESLETVEYAVMTALLLGALILAIRALAAAVSNRFNATAGALNGLDDP